MPNTHLKYATVRLVEDFAQVTFFSRKTEAEKIADQTDAALITSEEDLVESFSGPYMVKIFNNIVDELIELGGDPSKLKHTKRFATKEAGAKAVTRLLSELAAARAATPVADRPAPVLAPAPAEPEPAPEPKAKAHPKGKVTPKEKPAAAKPNGRPSRGVNIAPKGWLKPCREGSKQQTMLDLLSRPEGATLDELREALSGGRKPWADTTIKSAFNWDMNAVKGYGVRTDIEEDGTHRYHVVLPKGVKKPLSPTPLKGK